ARAREARAVIRVGLPIALGGGRRLLPGEASDVVAHEAVAEIGVACRVRQAAARGIRHRPARPLVAATGRGLTGGRATAARASAGACRARSARACRARSA